jgi:flagellar basal-body rod protein FlgC
MAIPEIYSINLFGMNYERARLEAASMNIANANIISGTPTSGYKPVGVNLDSVPTAFSDYLTLAQSIDVTIKPGQTSKSLFKPDHPLAGNDGFVFKANVNLAEEMITLNAATRAYEANVKAFNTYKEMAGKAMEIGK